MGTTRLLIDAITPSPEGTEPFSPDYSLFLQRLIDTPAISESFDEKKPGYVFNYQTYAAFIAFQTMWEQLSEESFLDEATRAKISDYLLIFDEDFAEGKKAAEKEKAFQDIDICLSDLEELTESATTTIRDYRTKQQIRIRRTGKVLGAILAFAFGFLESGITVFLTLSGVFTGHLLIFQMAGYVLGLTSSWIMWKIYGEKMPEYLQKFFGKDTWFQGFTEGLDAAQKKKLALFTLFFALPGALAAGAGTFAVAADLPMFLGLAALGAGVPWIGGVLAAVVVVVLVFRLVDGYSEFLKSKSSTFDFLMKPIQELFKSIEGDHLLSSNQKKWAKRGSVFVALFLFLLSLAGLFFACFAMKGTVQDFANKTLNLNLKIAASLGYIIGLTTSFIARFYFVMKEVAKTASVFSQRAFLKKKEGELNTGEFVSAGADAIMEGVFYYVFLSKVMPGPLAIGGAMVTTTRSMGVSLPSLVAPSSSANLDPVMNVGNKLGIKSDLQQEKFTLFKRAFKNQYKAEQGIFSRSNMHQKLAAKEIKTIEQVEQYAYANPRSRSGKLFFSLQHDKDTYDFKHEFYKVYANCSRFETHQLSEAKGMLDKNEMTQLETYIEAHPKSFAAETYYKIKLKDPTLDKEPLQKLKTLLELAVAESTFSRSSMLRKINNGDFHDINEVKQELKESTGGHLRTREIIRTFSL